MAVIEKNGFVLLDHPPYSPDLAPSDFYLFRHMKKHLRGKIYQNAADLQQDVELFLKDQSPIFFKNAFLELLHRLRKCVDHNGSYIET
jgi:histone-lysine N-methyltransferase SETMAR